MIISKKIFSLFALIFCLTSSAQTKQKKLEVDSTKVSAFAQIDTAYWVVNFQKFRNAIFLKDKAKTKLFFNFPVKNEGNEIWYLAYGQNEKAINKLPGSIKPFTAADFDKYFNKIFPKYFVKSLLKIKTDELFKKGAFETTELKDSTSTFKLYVVFDKENNLLELNFASKTLYKDENGHPLDDGEFNIIYYFDITKKGHVKFKKVKLAG